MPSIVKVAEINEVPTGCSRLVEVDEQLLALFNIDGTFYAIDDACPHQSAPLSEGAIRGCVVICPRHGWEFDVTSGKQLCPPGNLVAETYPVFVNGNDVFITISD